MAAERPLNILHVFRAPVGGLFRHVLDLTRGQIERGHRVGLIADSSTGGERAETALNELSPRLALGLSRIAMPRVPSPLDFPALLHVSRRIGTTGADVVHGHGAKGGLYARLAPAPRKIVRGYTPHGGSLWFEPTTLMGKLILTTEKLLMPRGNLYIFESEGSARTFERKIGKPNATTRVVHNGVTKPEFEPVALTPDATDLVYLGELRTLKGVDILIEALAKLRAGGRTVTATLVGDGPDKAAFQAAVATHDLGGSVRFLPPMPARSAFALGRVMVVPSRAEGLPYVVLEAAAAGKPLIATAVGGIPEIFGPQANELISPADPTALAEAISARLANPEEAAVRARTLRERVAAGFTTDAMVESIEAGYRQAIAALEARR